MFRPDLCCSNKIGAGNSLALACPGVLDGGGGGAGGKTGEALLPGSIWRVVLGESAGPAGQAVRIVEKQTLSAVRIGDVAPALVAQWQISAVFQYVAKGGRQIASFATRAGLRAGWALIDHFGGTEQGGLAPQRGSCARSHLGSAGQRPFANRIAPQPDPQSALMAEQRRKNREMFPARQGVGGSGFRLFTRQNARPSAAAAGRL